LVPEVALGAYNVYVEAGETESNTKTFTVVEQGSSSSDMVIDDFEGTKVSPTSYYLFDDDSSKPLYEVQTTEIAEGSQALKVQYTYLNLGEDDWGGGIGASLAQSLDISSASAVTLMIKGDGSQNSVRLDLIDEDGESWSSEQISLSRTGWYQVTLDLDDFTFNTFGTTGNGVFNKTITGYQLVYTTKYSSTSYHYVDYIVAVAESDDTNRPVIVSVDPSEATVGSTVTIVGSNFGATQSESEVRLGGVSVGSVISSWSDSQIVFVLPDTFETGEYDLQVYRKDATQGIDALSEAKPFRVIAASTKAKVYPNPFNPLSETIKIQVSATEAMEVSLFIYDITARVIYKTSASLSVGTNEITWDGKNYLNAIVGDGVYLVRVVNNANKELISKAKILVIKRN
jgi:flagellar hook assembly protein FlgD